MWNETHVLPDSQIVRLAAFARHSGDQWFIGVINDTMPHRETVSLSLLGQGDYKLVELADNIAERDAAFVHTESKVTRKNSLTLPLCKDGGYVAWLVPVAAKFTSLQKGGKMILAFKAPRQTSRTFTRYSAGVVFVRRLNT
jgi:hypothetical protein